MHALPECRSCKQEARPQNLPPTSLSALLARTVLSLCSDCSEGGKLPLHPGPRVCQEILCWTGARSQGHGLGLSDVRPASCAALRPADSLQNGEALRLASADWLFRGEGSFFWGQIAELRIDFGFGAGNFA